MNHTPFYRLALLVAVSNLTLVSAAHTDDSIFPDKGLESAVRQEVFAKRYNQEPITKEDVKNISQVHGKGLGIKSLAGLEHWRGSGRLQRGRELDSYRVDERLQRASLL